MEITLPKGNVRIIQTRITFSGQRDKNEIQEITKEQYQNFICATSFFENLGGYEKNFKEETDFGLLITKNISVSPCKTIRKITSWEFMGV